MHEAAPALAVPHEMVWSKFPKLYVRIKSNSLEKIMISAFICLCYWFLRVCQDILLQILLGVNTLLHHLAPCTCLSYFSGTCSYSSWDCCCCYIPYPKAASVPTSSPTLPAAHSAVTGWVDKCPSLACPLHFCPTPGAKRRRYRGGCWYVRPCRSSLSSRGYPCPLRARDQKGADRGKSRTQQSELCLHHP